MKRRSFLQAIGGAVAAVFVPVAAADNPNRRAALEQLAAAFRETRDIQERAWLNNDPRMPPETLAELRAVIEAAYKSVRPDDPPMEEVFVHPLGMTSYGFAVDFPPGPTIIFTALPVTGVGSNEREAVLIAFNRIKEELGGKELIWRRKPEMEWWKDVESGRECFVVSGRAMVLR